MYKPKNKEELKKLLFEDKVDAEEIDVSNVTGMSWMFDNSKIKEEYKCKK